MLQIKSSQYIKPKAKGISGDDACDHTILDNTLFISVLCDGVGSARKGGAAARQTVKYFMNQFKTRPKAWDIGKSITVFTQHINRMLFKESMSQYEQIEFLTTLSIAVIEEETLYTTNLGDSHIYLQRDNGPLQLLSVDHNMDDEHMSHVLTQACGLNDHVEPEVQETQLQIGDKVIICSDGVYNLISDEELAEKINKGLSAKIIVESVTKEHKDNDRDDATLQIFTVTSFDERNAAKKQVLTIPETLNIGDQIDGYTLVSPMMEHGRIWRVQKGNKTLVMKFPMNSDEESVDQFVHEAWYAKQISHKAFGDAWIPEDRTYRYYLMELIEGNNLMDFLKGKHLSVDNAINLAKFLHKAEAHLLNLGLVHGDIKPENIIVYRDKDIAGTRFKMVDFGSIVEIFSENSRAGTPTYLAPERFSNSAINESTEVFSIGVTIYWALTGKYPYGDIEPFQTPKFKPAQAPSKFNKNIPDWLDSVIMRAIAIDPIDRYDHYSELFYELKDPANVKPYFAKGSTFVERNPVKAYKTAFFGMIAIEIATVLYFTT